jgi:C4-dicarboxylate-specific signal transduction histidine kinase
MAERHTPSIEVLACQPASLRAMVDAIRHERKLRPLLTRLVQHAYEATKRRGARIAIINRIGGVHGSTRLTVKDDGGGFALEPGGVADRMPSYRRRFRSQKYAGTG